MPFIQHQERTKIQMKLEVVSHLNNQKSLGISIYPENTFHTIQKEVKYIRDQNIQIQF